MRLTCKRDFLISSFHLQQSSFYFSSMNFAQKKRSLLVLLFLFTLFIIYGTIIPFRFTDLDTAKRKIGEIVWCLSFDCLNRSTSRFDLFQNLLLFLPAGLLWGVFFCGSKRYISGVLISFFYGLVLSSGVETLQLFTADRIVSIKDVITNVAGSVCGFVAAVAVLPYFRKNILIHPGWRDAPREIVAPAIASVLVISDFLRPFDFSLDVSMVAEKVRLLQYQPFNWVPAIRDDPGILLLYMFLTCTILQCKRALFRQIRSGLVISVLIVSVFATAAFQLIIISRIPAGLDIISGVVGIAFGVIFYAVRGPFRLVIFQVLMIISIVSKYLFPFTVASEYQKGNWSPLLFRCSSTIMWYAGHIIELSVFFIFAGFATFYFARNTKLRIVLIIIDIAGILVLEVLQMQGAGVIAGVIDLIVVLCALLAGMALGKIGSGVVENVHE
ncbi:MAG: VanZ family protein [Chitinispirillaceae bacterium]|nr:VanZ family protein [Chitinispirillaceae bacterium]